MAIDKENPNMRKELERWLEHRGIALKDVMLPFTVKHEYGQTQITITMIAQDFPVPAGSLLSEDEPVACAFHTDCGKLIDRETPQ